MAEPAEWGAAGAGGGVGLPAERAGRLVVAARGFAGELELPAVAGRLRALLAELPDVTGGVLGVCDEERGTFTSYVIAPDVRNTPIVEHEDVVTRDDLEWLRAARGRCVALERPRGDSSPLVARWRTAGIHDGLLAPVFLQEQFLGVLIVGGGAAQRASQELRAFLAELAHLLGPVIWNCHTHARFRRGDRRRDALIEVSNAVNQSLELATVLASARQAFRGLAALRVSAINLLSDDGETYQSYRDFPGRDGANEKLPEPLQLPTGGTVVSWVREHGQTYLSGDLKHERRFEHDDELRELGVRRYVATPMFVRQRIIGCLLFGTDDHRQTLKIDVWLQENFAVQLALAVDNARQLAQVQQLSERLAQQNVYLREEIHREHDFSGMVGDTAAMRRVREAIQRVARTDSTVLITGETGVGKELVARAIHAASARAEHPMVKVNCAAIPEGMVESELFGHERGAFTSAVERRIGRFELARDGTLFLDEVGELSPAVQAKLLRVLQDGQFERVGGTRTLHSNARIIAATNRNLLSAVAEGLFRNDLYYRLAVFPIEVPPLRERPEDVAALVQHFIQQLARRTGKRIEGVSAEALELLCRRDWPGNIRELRHVIERAMILCDGTVLDVAVLGLTPGARPSAGVRPGVSELGTLAEAEAAHIRRVLEHTGGVIEGPRGAAQVLGLKPSTLRFRMKRLGLRRPG